MLLSKQIVLSLLLWRALSQLTLLVAVAADTGGRIARGDRLATRFIIGGDDSSASTGTLRRRMKYDVDNKEIYSHQQSDHRILRKPHKVHVEPLGYRSITVEALNAEDKAWRGERKEPVLRTKKGASATKAPKDPKDPKSPKAEETTKVPKATKTTKTTKAPEGAAKSAKKGSNPHTKYPTNSPTAYVFPSSPLPTPRSTPLPTKTPSPPPTRYPTMKPTLFPTVTTSGNSPTHPSAKKTDMPTSKLPTPDDFDLNICESYESRWSQDLRISCSDGECICFDAEERLSNGDFSCSTGIKFATLCPDDCDVCFSCLDILQKFCDALPLPTPPLTTPLPTLEPTKSPTSVPTTPLITDPTLEPTPSRSAKPTIIPTPSATDINTTRQPSPGLSGDLFALDFCDTYAAKWSRDLRISCAQGSCKCTDAEERVNNGEISCIKDEPLVTQCPQECDVCVECLNLLSVQKFCDAKTKPPVKSPTIAPVVPLPDLPSEPNTKPPVKSPTDAPFAPLPNVPSKQNTKPPVKSPTDAPFVPLPNVPSEPNTKPPVKIPTDAPVVPLPDDPSVPNTKPPVKIPIDAPVVPLPNVPSVPNTKPPVKSLTNAPVVPLPNVPSIPNTKPPVKSPTNAPVVPLPNVPYIPNTKPPVKSPTDAPFAPTVNPNEFVLNVCETYSAKWSADLRTSCATGECKCEDAEYRLADGEISCGNYPLVELCPEDCDICKRCLGEILVDHCDDIKRGPSLKPIVRQTLKPAVPITSEPTMKPTVTFTSAPTMKPTASITSTPTSKPTEVITSAPTMKPTVAITSAPTIKPTDTITSAPTLKPIATIITMTPTASPTKGAFFDLSNCEDYNGVWLSELIEYGTCDATQDLIGLGVIQCGEVKCPNECLICDLCLRSNNCSQKADEVES